MFLLLLVDSGGVGWLGWGWAWNGMTTFPAHVHIFDATHVFLEFSTEMTVAEEEQFQKDSFVPESLTWLEYSHLASKKLKE